MDVQPGEHFCNWQQDPLGNYQARLVFPEKTDHFTVTVNLVVDMVVFNPFDSFLKMTLKNGRLSMTMLAKKNYRPSWPKLKRGSYFISYLIGRPEKTPDDRFFGRVQSDRAKAPEIYHSDGAWRQTPEESLGKRSGSCRDSAWLLVQLLRHLGVASRFVSGYLIQLRPDKESVDGPNGAETDFY